MSMSDPFRREWTVALTSGCLEVALRARAGTASSRVDHLLPVATQRLR
jgi:hypothetical protein